MKPNKPNAQEKRSTLETLHTLWVPMAVGAVLLVMLAIVANLVWKDYSTALMVISGWRTTMAASFTAATALPP